MLDINFIRENQKAVQVNCDRRGAKVSVDEVVSLDDKRKKTITELDGLRGKQNRESKVKPSQEKILELKKLSETIGKLEIDLKSIEESLYERLSWFPNMLDPEVPDGTDDSGNVPIKYWGEVPKFDFEPHDHQMIGESLDILDMERGAKVSQSRFYFLKNAGARLRLALVQFAFDYLAQRGFTIMTTPHVAREKTLFGTGYLPFFADDIYKLEGHDLALIGTSEQTLVAYHMDEVLRGDELPKQYTAHSECFRTEAGSYGKDTRGIFRVHEFMKVEQIVFCTPETSPQFHEKCLENEEGILKALKIPYRVVLICVGDFGAPGYKKYDVEAWFPGQNKYREVTSNTNLTDFQTRRLNIRYRTEQGSLMYPHTISATGVTDRHLIAIIENYQQKDGSVKIPDVLVPYMGGVTEIRKE
ncbi:MAG: Seryl-tRNA synthetase [Parcubacteria group bacterium GW2011_GWB1_46_8]|nr:MAG: Seryl-tRNA synthetase [Parcubacteria group bacterium GW2011_GWA1_45_7]KKU10972.1 MAG: Seryl-tRNA synthetase [Parcubacteria group bacterium GW2011_GWF1_45_5]KKU46159.1 MAG: Seryl-tRNA synthetase [Parcubacteria group bacterium GW2011_GWB1_46_8]